MKYILIITITTQYSSTHVPILYKLGLGTEFRSEKIPRNRLGMVSVIPRKKVLIPRHSEFRGRAYSEAQNGTEFRGKKIVLQNSQNTVKGGNFGNVFTFKIVLKLFHNNF
jgi:hypothetical protein